MPVYSGVRVMVRGDAGQPGRRVAATLTRGGCDVVASGACDVVVTVSIDPAEALPGAAEALGIVHWQGRPLRLSRIERAVFACLARASAPMSRQALLSAVWGYRFDPGTNLIAVHICRLRAKVGRGSIVHEDGGYRLRDAAAAAAACNSSLG